MKISSVKMLKFWCMNSLLLLLLLLLWALMLASGDGSNNTTSTLWQTLHGNKSSGLRKEEVSKFMVLVDNKSLVSLTAPQDLPPAQAPKPVSTETNVVEPPVPSVGSKAIPPFDGRNRFISSAPPPKPNEQSKSPADKYINILIILFIVMGVLAATFVIGVIFVTILAFVSQWACPRLREWLRGFGI
ncbi:hypothetical protein Vadar_011522 [Vaccinium darrowii]|uniref:Uncharacterized protein n=1 Tax=Vaccinium darrowii TaxID=229202 RepID=A0ACB7XGV8_9ERIC|nr:hypothetical protein Vadar_011522 [Vaccinium darrowii]